MCIRDSVDAAVELAEQLIADQVVLRSASDAGFLVFTKTMLANALVSDARDGDITLSFDPERITPFVMQKADEFAIEAVDASFEFDQETKEFSILETNPARTVDLEAVPQAVYDAAAIGLNGVIPMVDGAEPAFTTLDAQAMGELGEVVTYTTYHPCCANRVINIQTIAAAVDGAIVMPGETFSVNEHVGQRTTAKGYGPAGAIIGGRVECCDSPINIGGGTSQFATTLWNAIFFGCYEDVTHTPHSIYFDRYPFIREATLGFPSPDVAFTNDSDAVLVIDTSWTSGSITVSIYGNNGGRTCESETSGNTNTRIMTHPDGSVSTETWTWNYRKELPPETVPTTAPAPTTSTEVTSTPAAPTTTEATTTTTAAPTTTEATTTTAAGGGETP